MSNVTDFFQSKIKVRMSICTKIQNSIPSIPDSFPKRNFALRFPTLADTKAKGAEIKTTLGKIYYSVLETVGLKVKETLKDGATKSFKLAKEIDEKYCLNNQAKALDERYQISTTTTRVATNVGEKGKEVFADAKKQDPTGILSVAEKYISNAWCFLLGYGADALEQVAQLRSEDNVCEDGMKSADTFSGKLKEKVEANEAPEIRDSDIADLTQVGAENSVNEEISKSTVSKVVRKQEEVVEHTSEDEDSKCEF